jgi:ketosteroid isomerase-like protein
MRLFFLAMLLLQSPPVQPAGNPDIVAVTKQLNIFAQRMHDKQEDAILVSYTPDAVFIDPSGKRFTTPTQMRKLYDQVFATYDSDLHFSTPVLVMHGHAYHVSGTFTEDLRDRHTGTVQHLSGIYQFRLAAFYDGHWSFTRMQWGMTQ